MIQLDKPFELTLRKLLIYGGGGILCILIISLSLWISTSMRISAMRDEYAAAIRTQGSVSETVSLYTLREHDGRIGIFESGNKTPLKILDVYTFTLPEADREALKRGIRVYSDEALLSLIEDFTG